MESPPQNPNDLFPPSISSVEAQPLPSVLPPPPPTPTSLPQPTSISHAAASRSLFSFPKRPAVRVTTEFDSDSSIFFHKVSCKLLDSVAKLKLVFQNNSKGEVSEPQLSFISKNLSIHYDVEEQSTFVKSSFDVGSRLHFSAAHDVKSQQGEVAMVARIADPGYSLQLCSAVPAVGLPKATLKFPLGEVSLEETEGEEVSKKVYVDGILKGQLLSGICTAHYKDENLNLRYSYKDEELSFIPSVSLPSNALSLAFKRRFGPTDKLSYWYNFDSDCWSAVYKHTYGKDFKFKAGYDSDVRLGWASLWVGDEAGKAKTAPMKTKVQFMLQVPQDDIKSSVLMFRVKKRWDI